MPEWLRRLYPPRWRQRYGDELDQLVRDLRGTRSRRALAVDLLRGALDAQVQERFAMEAADRRAIGRGAMVAGVVWLGLSVEIFLSNVVFPSPTDDDLVSVVVSYLCVFAALFLTGVLAGRGGAGRRGQILAGVVAGMLIGSLTVVTFAVVDNVWLDVVARQPPKVDGFAASHASSRRAYINEGLVGAAVFLTVMFGVVGAVLALAGGLTRREFPPAAIGPPGR